MTKKSRTRFILKLPGIDAEAILSRYEKIPIIQTMNIEDSFQTTKHIVKDINYNEITSMKLLLDNGQAYPDYTNSRCKWDHYPFETHPIGIPVKYYKQGYVHHFVCEGYFCSLNCLQSYIKKMACANPIYTDIALNFNLLCQLVVGTNNISDASEWEYLECYNDGVGLNIDELRKGQVTYRKTYNIKLIPCGEYYESILNH